MEEECIRVVFKQLGIHHSYMDTDEEVERLTDMCMRHQPSRIVKSEKMKEDEKKKASHIMIKLT